MLSFSKPEFDILNI